MAVPADLAGVRALAGSCRLAMGLHDVHALMTFFALCVGLGAAPVAAPDTPLVPEAVGLEALELVREIAGWCPPEALHWNSIGEPQGQFLLMEWLNHQLYPVLPKGVAVRKPVYPKPAWGK